jgi:hypothetical protein
MFQAKHFRPSTETAKMMMMMMMMMMMIMMMMISLAVTITKNEDSTDNSVYTRNLLKSPVNPLKNGGYYTYHVPELRTLPKESTYVLCNGKSEVIPGLN